MARESVDFLDRALEKARNMPAALPGIPPRRRADGDGAADIDDACPDDAEDGLPPKANDGCSATDPDNDGVLLADDRCPDAKEDGLPPSPVDGCPMADADGDGVADARDRCPGQSEDNQAPEPSDGYPSPDGDHSSRSTIASKIWCSESRSRTLMASRRCRGRIWSSR
jgi:hypothetical protein